MLVLSRRLNEKILFAGMSVSVEVVAIKPGAVRLGIEAPRDVPIYRQELLPLKSGENPVPDTPAVSHFSIVASNPPGASMRSAGPEPRVM